MTPYVVVKTIKSNVHDVKFINHSVCLFYTCLSFTKIILVKLVFSCIYYRARVDSHYRGQLFSAVCFGADQWSPI